MKKIINRCLILLFLSLIYFSCHKEDKTIPKNPFEEWVGTWKLIDYEYESTGDFHIYPGYRNTNNYKVENGKLIHSHYYSITTDSFKTDLDTMDFKAKFFTTILKNDTLRVFSTYIKEGSDTISLHNRPYDLNLREGIYRYGSSDYWYSYDYWDKYRDTLRHSYKFLRNNGRSYEMGIDTWLKLN